MNSALRASYTRDDLMNAIHQRQGVTMDEAREVVEVVIRELSLALSHRQRIEFRGFGALEVVRRGRKVGRNPKNPQAGTYRIGARNVVKFRTGKKLDAALNR